MTKYLVDTNVISELAPGKKFANAGLLEWLATRQDFLFLSVVTPIEILSGVVKLGRLSPGRRHEAMAGWYHELSEDFGDRILPLTREIVRHAAMVTDRNAARGLHPGWPDVVVAATVEVHGMTLLTRNVRHFATADVPVVDPFQSLPE